MGIIKKVVVILAGSGGGAFLGFLIWVALAEIWPSERESIWGSMPVVMFLLLGTICLGTVLGGVCSALYVFRKKMCATGLRDEGTT